MSKEKKLSKAIFPASCVIERQREYIKLSPTLNDIMGGLLGGSFVIVTGIQKGGKTITCLDIAARAQKVGYNILYADIEHRVHKRDLASIKGLDLSPERFSVMRSSKGNILDAEDFVEMIYEKMQTEDKLIVIADSISQLCPRDLRSGEIGDNYRDQTPGILSRLSKVLASNLGITNNIFIGITHIIANTSGKGYKTRIEASGNKIQYAMDFKIEVSHATKWQDIVDGPVIGQDIHWKCENSILVTKGRTGVGKFRYGTPETPEGIDDVAELFDIADTYKVVNSKGAWYNFGDKQFQGKAKFIQAMKEDKELFDQISEGVALFNES